MSTFRKQSVDDERREKMSEKCILYMLSGNNRSRGERPRCFSDTFDELATDPAGAYIDSVGAGRRKSNDNDDGNNVERNPSACLSADNDARADAKTVNVIRATFSRRF